MKMEVPGVRHETVTTYDLDNWFYEKKNLKKAPAVRKICNSLFLEKKKSPNLPWHWCLHDQHFAKNLLIMINDLPDLQYAQLGSTICQDWQFAKKCWSDQRNGRNDVDHDQHYARSTICPIRISNLPGLTICQKM